MLSEALAASPLLRPESGTIPNPGGVFPASRVNKIISGDQIILGAWLARDTGLGPIFHEVEADRDYGEIRLQDLTDYLKSVQK